MNVHKGRSQYGRSVLRPRQGQGKLERIFRLLFRMPPFAKRLLEYFVIVVLTNHTAITDLINLIKVIRWW